MNSDSKRWWVLATVILGTFMGRLDQTIVNLALPKIIDDFAITVTEAGWIATAYILANAVFVPIWGKLGDTLGRKKIYILGFAGFIFGSALAGFSWNLPSMIFFRIVQAVAASADYPTAMAILAVTFTENKERAQALGIWSAAFAASAVVGPLVGGPLIDNFNWRAIFLINIPVGIVGLLMAMKFIEESVSEKKARSFDWWGSLTLGVSLAALVLVLDQGASWGWASSASVFSYVVSAVFMLIFILIEKGVSEPVIDLKFFRIGAFVNTLANNFIVFMGMMGSVFLLPIFSQTFLGYTATESGYLFIPMAVALVIASPLGGSLTGKIQARYVIMASTAVAALGLFMFSYIDPRSTALDLILPLAVMAFGIGFGMAQRTNIIASVVPQEEVGSASAVLALGRNIAGAFGIAVAGTILTNSIGRNILNLARDSALNLINPETIKQFAGLIILRAQISSYALVFEAAAALVLFGAITAFWINVPNEDTGAEIFVE